MVYNLLILKAGLARFNRATFGSRGLKRIFLPHNLSFPYSHFSKLTKQ